MKDIEKTSKFLSFVLRHRPDAISLAIDSQGWASIDQLIQKSQKEIEGLTLSNIKVIIQSSEKKRFEISHDEKMIRAIQGHSTPLVTRKFMSSRPPNFLYHGTAKRFLRSIFKQGLLSRKRHHVHLTSDYETALETGRRYGASVVLYVNSGEMSKQGFEFFLAENNVWLTARVPTEFITVNQ